MHRDEPCGDLRRGDLVLFPLDEVPWIGLYLGRGGPMLSQYYFLSPRGLIHKYEVYVKVAAWCEIVQGAADFVSAP